MINGWGVSFSSLKRIYALPSFLHWSGTRYPTPCMPLTILLFFKLFYGLCKYSNELHANEEVMLVGTMIINHSSVSPCTVGY